MNVKYFLAKRALSVALMANTSPDLSSEQVRCDINQIGNDFELGRFYKNKIKQSFRRLQISMPTGLEHALRR